MDEPREPTIDEPGIVEPQIIELTTDKLDSVTGGDLLYWMIVYAISHCDCVFPTTLRK
jgi:hypothetical protein